MPWASLICDLVNITFCNITVDRFDTFFSIAFPWRSIKKMLQRTYSDEKYIETNMLKRLLKEVLKRVLINLGENK